MKEQLEALKQRTLASLQRARVFYSNHRMLLLSGLTVLSILLIVWARLGFTLDFGKSFANLDSSPCGDGTCDSDESVIGVSGYCAADCAGGGGGGGGATPTVSSAPTTSAAPTSGAGATGQCHWQNPDERGTAACACNSSARASMCHVCVKPWTEGNTDYSDGQWTAWDNLGLCRPSCPNSRFPYETERTMMNGSKFAFPAYCVEKPVDCPDGYHAYGASQCESNTAPATVAPTPTPTASKTPTPTPSATVPATPTPTATATSTVSPSPSSTPKVTINTIPSTLTGQALGTISGTAADAVGITKVRVVIRYKPSTTGTCTTESRDWDGTAWVTGCQVAGQITPSIVPGTATTWSVANTPPLAQMNPGLYRIFAAAYRSETPLIWTTWATYTDTTYSAATTTPTPGPGFSLSISGRNVTAVGAQLPTVQAKGGEQVEAIVVVRNTQSVPLNNVILRTILPTGLTYVAGSTSVAGTPTAVDSITTGGLAIGSIAPQRDVTVTFRALVVGSSFVVGTTQVAITVNANADGAAPQQVVLPIIVTRAAAGTPGTVKTGPGEATFVALLMSAIMTLLYVSYTRTSAYKRKEIEGIAHGHDPMDFRS